MMINNFLSQKNSLVAYLFSNQTLLANLSLTIVQWLDRYPEPSFSGQFETFQKLLEIDLVVCWWKAWL